MSLIERRRPTAVVETTGGDVRGAAEDGLDIFKGIPFAAAPVGDLRFRPPQPLSPWPGVRDATEFGPIPVGTRGELHDRFGLEQREMSEDCLSLNIWTPGCDDSRRPVMVWIFGGAFSTGSSTKPGEDGASFARTGDVVVVSINYRVGALGFLHVDGNGNNGLLDQVAALEWVRDNIAAFGGDPGNVTVFGCSAGGISIGTLMGMPAARGLFTKAILESGAYHAPPSEVAEGVASTFIASLGIEPGPGALDRLRALPAAAILDAQSTFLQGSLGARMPFSPVVDGVVLPASPIERIAQGSAAGVAVLIGTTRDEAQVFTVLRQLDDTLDDAELVTRLGRMSGRSLDRERVAELVASYRSRRPGVPAAHVLVELQGDEVFWVPSIRLAERQSVRGDDVFMYRFDHASALGAHHGLEVPFVFNNIDDPRLSVLVGEVTDGMRTLARRMHEAWFTFARTGRPAADGLPDWPNYETGRRATMVLDVDPPGPAVIDDPRGSDRAQWVGLLREDVEDIVIAEVATDAPAS